MGQKVTFDPLNKIIQVDVAPVGGEVVLDWQVDFYSDMKEDWQSDANLSKYRPPITAVGGGQIGTSYFLDAAWKVRPYEANHRLILSGNVKSTDGSSIFTFTQGTFQVLTEQQVSNIVDTVSTGSGVTEQDKLDIAGAVWDEVL